jgi:hypothetical protein
MAAVQPRVFSRRPGAWALVWTVAALSLIPTLALAQTTRTEQLAQQRAERARGQTAPPPAKLERWLQFVEDRFLQQRSLPAVASFYPRAGGVVPESGFGAGPGYRRSFANDTLRIDASALVTNRRYWIGRAELALPRLFARTLELKAIAQARHLPEEDFFGLGPDSALADRVNYRLDETAYVAQAIWQPRRWLQVASQHAWLNPRIGPGGDSDHPSIERRFTDTTAAGSATTTSFLEHGALAMVDWRDSDGRPRRGGRYVLYASHAIDRHDRGFGFSRLAAHVEHYVPVFDRKRVVAIRLTASHLAAAAGSRVPFYYMPSLGGMDSHHGFDHFRFRDASIWVFSAEYRWEAIAGLDLAVLYDRGGVARRFTELSLATADDAYGIGVRVGTESAVFLRTEVSFGAREGARWFIGASTPFKLERVLR